MRAAIVTACRAMNTLGLNQGMSGNISVRHGDGLLITPTATPYDLMQPADIAELPLAGEGWTGPRRPLLRVAVPPRHSCRPAGGSAPWCTPHPAHCTALAMMRRGIPPCHYMIANFGGDDVRCAGYATFGTQALSDLALEALADRSACLLANHGMIACGRDLDQAMSRAVELEALARQYLVCLSAGGPVLLSPADISAAQRRFGEYRP